MYKKSTRQCMLLDNICLPSQIFVNFCLIWHHISSSGSSVFYKDFGVSGDEIKNSQNYRTKMLLHTNSIANKVFIEPKLLFDCPSIYTNKSWLSRVLLKSGKASIRGWLLWEGWFLIVFDFWSDRDFFCGIPNFPFLFVFLWKI